MPGCGVAHDFHRHAVNLLQPLGLHHTFRRRLGDQAATVQRENGIAKARGHVHIVQHDENTQFLFL